MLARPLFALCLALSLPAIAQSTARCRVGSFEGEVRAGQRFNQRLSSALELQLDPLPSGWRVRVLPVGSARPPYDYAELATPPYRSINPLLLSTDFSLRAQDVVGWTPRRFRYAADAQAFDRLSRAYTAYLSGPGAASQQQLAVLAAQAPEAVLTILDAHLVPGVADQPREAATLASHFSATAHVIEPPPEGKPLPLGRISWLRFRIAVELPAGAHPDKGLKLLPVACGSL